MTKQRKDQPSPLELMVLALVVKERPGREIGKLYEQETETKLSLGALYTTLRRLTDEGWINFREGKDREGRLRFFKITGSGIEALNRGRERSSDAARFGKGSRIARGLGG